MCRKYGWLRNRVLLYRQDELNEMERRLLAMDDEDKDEYPIALRSRKFDEEDRPDVPDEYSRKTLIMQIDEKLKQYGRPPSTGNWRVSHLTQSLSADDLISRIVSTVALKAPSSRNYRSWKTWIWDRKPLTREETTFTKYGDDLVSLSTGQEAGCFDGMVEDMLDCLPRPLIQVITSSQSLHPCFPCLGRLTH